VTEQYEYQPLTKTYEYLLSGLICIATKTAVNKKVITEENGFLCDDNSESVYDALCSFMTNDKTYDSRRIKNAMSHNKWSYIVDKYLRQDILEN
jgi:glycosyltransferase involved in cell wall biosynthesis